MQRKCPHRMTPRLRNWNFLPRWCHSLSVYDSCCSKISCKNKQDDDDAPVDADADAEAVIVEYQEKPHMMNGADNSAFSTEVNDVNDLRFSVAGSTPQGVVTSEMSDNL